VDETGRLAGLLSETDVLWAVATNGAPRRAPERDSLAVLVAELQRERERVRARLAQRIEAEHSIEAVMREEPLDEAERGADVTLLRESLALDELAVRRVAAIDAALDRVAQGHFGTCAKCGDPIPVPRLRALPSTTCCIGCARKASV
jgi:DnaK suppressor protein